jgi:hypothetical protein
MMPGEAGPGEPRPGEAGPAEAGSGEAGPAEANCLLGIKKWGATPEPCNTLTHPERLNSVR